MFAGWWSVVDMWCHLLQLLKHGVGLWTESDSEILTHLLINPAGDGEPDGADWLTRSVDILLPN